MTEFDRSSFFYFRDITTRWMDNDVYGHVNNVVYYSYFDSVANQYLIEVGGLDIHSAPSIAFVVASSCQYRTPVAYPDLIEGGLRVNRVGSSSVEYGIGIFAKGAEEASASGTFTHVFVNRQTNESTPIPANIREALIAINSN